MAAVDWMKLAALLDEHETFVISSHIRPDADALGSALGLAGYLQSRGKTVQIINPGATPNHLLFLDPQQQVRAIAQSPAHVQAIQNCQTHIIVDTSAWGQLAEVGKALAASPSRKIVIDHHVSADDLQAEEFKDIQSPATGCLIYELMEAVGYQPSKYEAECLYAAIATDTGWFRFPATTGKTMRIIAALMDAGAEPAPLYQQLYEQASLSRLHLSGIAMQRAQVVCDGKLAFTYVTLADLAATKAHPADTENLVNECMRIQNTQAAFILVEQYSKLFKASLRSRLPFDVTPIAETFGGGGHRQASGATLPGPLEAAIEQIVRLYGEQFAQQNPNSAS